jgi:phosphoketolase
MTTSASSLSTPAAPADATDLRVLDAWWRAANYLAVGQIYLMDNPLLREPLGPEHIKPRLLGHWGTTPGLTFLWAHLNRVVRRDEREVLYICGPGHGGPAVVATAYLEGTYSERYAHVTDDAEGMKALFRQFSFPGGIPSHAAPETPGSIHEGGELGYSLAHAYGAAFDNPGLLVACVIGDGEAETGPLAGSWQSNTFLHPVHDGTVLPILHLNGYKIANPTVPARVPQDELLRLLDVRPPAVRRGGRVSRRGRPGRRPDGRPRADGRHPGRGGRRGRPHPRPGPGAARGRRRRGPTVLADDRSADAQRLDRPPGGRRGARRGHVAGAPGAAR